MKKLTLILSLTAVLIFGGCREAKSEPLTPPAQEETQKPEEGDPAQEEPAVSEKEADYLVSSVEEFKALKLKAGDIVEWKNGTYADIQLKISVKGTEAEPVIFRAQTPGQVIFTGQSFISLAGEHLVASGFVWKGLDTSWKKSMMTCDKGSCHCTFSECLIDGDKSKVSDTDSKWVSLYGQYNTIANCEFYNKRNMGCLLVVWFEDGIVPTHTIRNNRFTRPYTHYDNNGKARNSQETIRIGTSQYSLTDGNCIVEGNWFYRCDGERAEIISNKSCGNLYRGNVFEESVGTLTLRHGNRCTVDGNYFLSNKKADVGGVRIIGADHIVENNVILNATGSGYMSAISLLRAEKEPELSGYWRVENAMVRNNILVNCRYGIVVNVTGRDTQKLAPTNATFKGNIIVSANNASYTPVECIDMEASEMHWLLNTIHKGKCKGIDLEMTDTEPVIKDYGGIIEEIKSKTGKSWK